MCENMAPCAYASAEARDCTLLRLGPRNPDLGGNKAARRQKQTWIALSGVTFFESAVCEGVRISDYPVCKAD